MTSQPNGHQQTPPSKLWGPLRPFSPPIALDPSGTVDHETVLTVTPASMGTDVQITDAEGNPVVVCESKWMSTKKVIKHATTGELLFTIHSGMFDSSKLGANAAGKEVFEVTRKNGDGDTKILIRFTNISTARPVEIIFQSDGRSNTRGQLSLDGKPVGRATQEYKTITSMPLTVTLAPGIDIALMAAVSVCLSGLFISRDTTSNAMMGTAA